MRLLWLENAESPWSKGDGWSVLSECGVEIMRTPDAGEAQVLLANKNPQIFVACAEVAGALDLLEKLRPQGKKSKVKVILISSVWGKSEFKEHSRKPGGAHRYAKMPMPIDGFLKVLEELSGEKIERRSRQVPPELNFDSAITAESVSPPKPDFVPEFKLTAAPPSAGDSGGTDVLRKYLRIKEEELSAALTAQEELRGHNTNLQQELHTLQLKFHEKEHETEEARSKAEQVEKERENLEQEVRQTKAQMESEVKAYQERVRHLEKEIDGSGQRYEELRNRVRKDIRRIRTHERELEAKLELSRKDSETLLQARDQKVLELQRRIDALEFDLDQVQDSRVQAEMEAERYLAKLSRVARALHIAIGMVEEEVARDSELDELEPFVPEKENVDEKKSTGSGGSEGGSGSAPMGAEPPPADITSVASPDLEALASDGEPTRIVTVDELNNESAGGGQGEAAG